MTSSDLSRQDAKPQPIESRLREIRAEELLRGQREVVITHEDKRYRLMLTRNGKLILQK